MTRKMGKRGERSKLNFFLLFIEEMEFRQMVVVIGLDLDGLFVLSPPFPFFAKEPASLGQVGIHDRMNYQDKVLMLVINQIAEIFFDFIFQNQC